MKKHFIYGLLLTTFLNLFVAGSCLASDVSGSTYTVFSGYSINYGTKSWGVTNKYIGNAYNDNGYQAVDYHDYIAWTSQWYPPEIGQGNANMYRVNLQNANGTVQSVSGFTAGAIRSYVLDPSLYYYNFSHNYSKVKASPYETSYRIMYTTTFAAKGFTFSIGTVDNYTGWF